MEYIYFILYTPYLTLENKREVLIKKLNRKNRNEIQKALIVSYSNINEMKLRYPKKELAVKYSIKTR